jgi:alpha-1,6-mannosyltransferase
MHLVDTTLFYSPTSGGVRRYLNAKHDWLKANTGWEHTLLVPGDTTRVARGDISTVGGAHLPGTFNYRLPLNPRAWTRTLAALEPDLIEVGDVFHPAWCAAQVAERRDIPLIAFFHSNLPQIIGRRLGTTSERVVGRYVRWVYERFFMVFAPSRLMCDYLSDLGVERPEYQPLGVDTEIFHPRRRREDLRCKLGLAPDTRLLVYAGRFSGEKNLPALRETFALLGRPYHLLLIGGGEYASPAENITVVPYRRDSHELARWLASGDALVHAGTSETFGLVILEAMACGRPVVGVRAGAVQELVDEQVGVLAEAATAPLLAQAVRDLYDRDLARLGAVARTRVCSRYTWSHALQLQLNAYASVSGRVRLAGKAEAAAPAAAIELQSSS